MMVMSKSDAASLFRMLISYAVDSIANQCSTGTLESWMLGPRERANSSLKVMATGSLRPQYHSAPQTSRLSDVFY